MPDTPTITTQEEVMFFDTDCGGVVHNLAYLRFIETARTRLATQMGMNLREMTQTHLFPALLRTEIDYRRAAVLGDILEITGGLESLDRLRFWCAFRITRPSDGSLIATSRQQLALVRIPPGKPERLPAEWLEKYSHLQKKHERRNQG